MLTRFLQLIGARKKLRSVCRSHFPTEVQCSYLYRPKHGHILGKPHVTDKKKFVLRVLRGTNAHWCSERVYKVSIPALGFSPEALIEVDRGYNVMAARWQRAHAAVMQRRRLPLDKPAMFWQAAAAKGIRQ